MTRSASLLCLAALLAVLPATGTAEPLTGTAEEGGNRLIADDEQDDGWLFMPASSGPYKADFSLALMAGEGRNERDDESVEVSTGVEFGFNSPWLQPRNENRLRTFFSHTTLNGDSFKTNSLELNWHLMTPVAPNLTLGLGPGIGWLEADARGIPEGENLSIQVGGNLTYRNGPWYLGLELRRQWSSTLSADGRSFDPDNTRLMLKLGFWLQIQY